MLTTLGRPEVNQKIDAIVETQNLHHQFRQGDQTLHILQHIQFQVQRGKITAIVGASGAGKSTLLHVLGGLQRPTEGKVFFNGEDLYKVSDERRAKFRNEKIGFVFQFYHLLPELSALENVFLPLMIVIPNKRRRDLQEKAQHLLEILGLGKRVHHRPNALSGGEQQRVAIARALVNHPEIVFCDEPTGNLDSETGEEILRFIQSLNEKMRTTFLLVTHDPEVAKIAPLLYQMRDGHLEEKK